MYGKARKTRRRQLRPGRILEVAWRLAQIPCRAAPPQRALACPCLLEWRVGLSGSRVGWLVCRTTRSVRARGFGNTTQALAEHHASVTNPVQNIEVNILGIEPLMYRTHSIGDSGNATIPGLPRRPGCRREVERMFVFNFMLLKKRRKKSGTKQKYAR